MPLDHDRQRNDHTGRALAPGQYAASAAAAGPLRTSFLSVRTGGTSLLPLARLLGSVPACSETFDSLDGRVVLRAARVYRDQVQEVISRIEELGRHRVADRREVLNSVGSLAGELSQK